MNDDQFKALKRDLAKRQMAEVSATIPQLDVHQVYELALHLACGMAGVAAGSLAAAQLRVGEPVDHKGAAEKIADDISTVVRQGGALRQEASRAEAQPARKLH